MWVQLKSMELLYFTSTLLFILSTVSAHMAISNPPAQGGPWTKNPAYDVHAWIGFRGKPFPCGGYPAGPVTTYSAGEIIPVRFWNFDLKDYKTFPPREGVPQARHGGGTCEFSLSYDGGKSWSVIGQYTKTCPDLYHEFPVQIPKNVPSCTDSNRCLFAWSWTASFTNQFYHHCANIIINSNNREGKLPLLDMKVVNVMELGQDMDTHALGDKIVTPSTGPNKTERALCTNGFYAYGGGAGTKGIDLGLIIGKSENPDPEDNIPAPSEGKKPDTKKPDGNTTGGKGSDGVTSDGNTRKAVGLSILMAFATLACSVL
ncbi:hypothetical protein BGZ76_000425 [Entomortierella beljakovae]|nr:hypothetical protein BGZ76_000425 [Entomortierella beljakovae]